MTTGLGLTLKDYTFDFAYIPGSAKTNPLAGMLRFGLLAKFGKKPDHEQVKILTFTSTEVLLTHVNTVQTDWYQPGTF